MKRTLYSRLTEWKLSPRRKPLMLYGARQVGKTYLLKEFAEREYSRGAVYVNCYKNPAVEGLFADNVNIDHILLGLSAIAGKSILPGENLLIFDEVQEIPSVVASLKYFCEQRPDLHIAVAGSLLGVMNMEGQSFPNGKVDILRLYPMTFLEFLDGCGQENMARLLRSSQWPIINPLAEDFSRLLREYYFVGGMPEAVRAFSETRDPFKVREIQSAILDGYQADIAKHTGREALRCRMVFESIPSQLARENKKFVYGAVKKGSRGAEFENAIQWLVDAGLVYKVSRATQPAVPLSFYRDVNAFKLFLLDVGLLGALAEAPASQILVSDNIFKEYKGAFTENYLLEQLVACPQTSLYYFSKENSTLEIAFLAQIGSKAYPIEVKAEENVHSKSLRQFVVEDHPLAGLHGLRFSMRGYARQQWMTNIPLWGVSPFVAGLLE